MTTNNSEGYKPLNPVPKEDWDTVEEFSPEIEALKDAVHYAQMAFRAVSGLGDFETRICAYYCTSTWFMMQINPFPLFTITGPQGTGKTTALRAFNEMAFRPVMFTASKITEPVLRDYLHDAHEGTAIIDEADEARCDLEAYLTMRYLRETAVSGKKVKVGDKEWETEKIPIRGATVLHKRQPYKDPAVESRSIFVTTVPNIDRVYLDPDVLKLLYSKMRGSATMARGAITLGKKVSIPGGYQVAGRVTDSFRPILLLAQRSEDIEFLDVLWGKIQDASKNLSEGQAYEPGPLLLQALIANLVVEDKLKFRPIPIEGCILKWVKENHGKVINAWQAAKIFRGYGLKVSRNKGFNHVVVEDIKAFIETCRKAGIYDEMLEGEFKKLK